MTRTLPALAACAAGVLIAAAVLTAIAQDTDAVDPVAALGEGNRLFRNGQIEDAIEAYRAGYSASQPHPTLLYNLGTALHHAGRLPEAILWYRRAADSEDPWLQENLWLARRSLGSQRLAPGGALGWISRHADSLRFAAIALAWVTLLLLAGYTKMPGWALALCAAAALTLYGGGEAAGRWGPRPAVIVADCATAAGELPAGTETWVRPTTDARWQIAGDREVICGRDTVELIFPEG